MSKRVAIYGGSFNPPHIGHVLAVAYSLAAHPVDEVLVVPCFVHPFAKELAPFADRFAMCQLAMGWMPGVTISRVEADLGGESRTLRTLEVLAERHPDWSMRLLVGSDILHDAPKWHGFSRVCALAPLLVLGRRGVDRDDAPEPLLPEVSSTEIRELLARPPAETEVRLAEIVPSAVRTYIHEQGLFRRAM
jgi:nicotinate-nucleotide adenylyltransferase